ncbi:MAG: endonuclease domain-containing protein [Xanthobacteraceae bacterium]
MSLEQAKRLRKSMTDAERRLWYRLRAHRFEGCKFKRQVPIGPYIVDFACLNHGLVVELDGGQHAESDRDLARDEFLSAKGFRVLRFWNNDALKNSGGVLDEIVKVLRGQTCAPSPGALGAPPSPLRGEGKARARPGR